MTANFLRGRIPILEVLLGNAGQPECLPTQRILGLVRALDARALVPAEHLCHAREPTEEVRLNSLQAATTHREPALRRQTRVDGTSTSTGLGVQHTGPSSTLGVAPIRLLYKCYTRHAAKH